MVVRGRILILLGLLFTAGASAAPTCRLSLDGRNLLLNTQTDPLVRIELVLSLLKDYSASRLKAAIAEDLLERGQLRLAALEPLSSFAARTERRDGFSIIYADSGELGVVAPLIFHEITHVLDEEFAAHYLAGEPLDAVKKQNLVLAAERLAYDSQQALIDELKERNDCAGAYYAHHGKRKNLVTAPVTDAQIRAGHL